MCQYFQPWWMKWIKVSASSISTRFLASENVAIDRQSDVVSTGGDFGKEYSVSKLTRSKHVAVNVDIHALSCSLAHDADILHEYGIKTALKVFHVTLGVCRP